MIKFDESELWTKVFTNVTNFVNYWKKFSFIIITSVGISWYGVHLILDKEDTGNGLTAMIVSVAILGWLISAKSADENLRRIKRVEYLSEAYEGIALYLRRDSNQKDYNDYLDGLEKSFTIIQLFGNRKEIKMVCEIIEKYNASDEGTIQCDTLLNILRDNLRKELQLPKALRYVRTMRISRNSQQNQTLNEAPSIIVMQN